MTHMVCSFIPHVFWLAANRDGGGASSDSECMVLKGLSEAALESLGSTAWVRPLSHNNRKQWTCLLLSRLFVRPLPQAVTMFRLITRIMCPLVYIYTYISYVQLRSASRNRCRQTLLSASVR